MDKVKYNKTYHLPYSPGLQKDDRVQLDLSGLIGKPVTVTEKRDGENSSLYSHSIHARSLDSVDHPSRHWLKGLWGNIRHEIPDGWRICGENLYAKHSIQYDELPSYFEVFSVWNERNYALPVDDTLAVCSMLGLHHVPILWRGIFDEDMMWMTKFEIDTEKQEGFVVRLDGWFHYDDFGKCVLKWVRANHVATNVKHWASAEIVPNRLRTP